MQYEKILDGITGKYSDAVYLLNCGEGEIIKKLIVKYNETDWEFIKRLASHFNQPIVPNYAAAGIRYSFSLGVYGKEYLLDSVSYKTGNNKEEFFQKTDNGVDNVFAQDFMFYEVESRDYIELGEKVRFKGQNGDAIRKEFLGVCDELFKKCILQQQNLKKDKINFMYFFLFKISYVYKKA